MPKLNSEQQIPWKSIITKLSWLVIFIVVLFSIVFSVKILGLKIQTDVHLNAEALLAFLIAFFSLALSIMFYFKTEETSNRFYDNTYKFTSDISRTLAEIRSEFGEHFRHLDKGYTRIADAVTTNPDILKSLEEAKKNLEEVGTDKPLKSMKAEDLDKAALLQKVRALEKKIGAADKNISKVLNEASSPIRDRVLSYTRRRLIEKLGGRSIMQISDETIATRLKKLIERGELPRQYIEDLKSISFIDDKGFLTSEFIDFIRHYAHLARSQRLGGDTQED